MSTERITGMHPGLGASYGAEVAPAPAETMTAVVKTAKQHQQINGSLEDGIRNAFMLVPTQRQRMELLNKLWKADEQLSAVERMMP